MTDANDPPGEGEARTGRRRRRKSSTSHRRRSSGVASGAATRARAAARSKARAEARGRRAEWLAAMYLRLTGWRVLARRLRTAKGEVDIVARRGNVLCFVEVKWRATREELGDAVSEGRLRRVAAAASLVARRYRKAGDTLRIDVILMAPRCWPRRIENALVLGSSPSLVE